SCPRGKYSGRATGSVKHARIRVEAEETFRAFWRFIRKSIEVRLCLRLEGELCTNWNNRPLKLCSDFEYIFSSGNGLASTGAERNGERYDQNFGEMDDGGGVGPRGGH